MAIPTGASTANLIESGSWMIADPTNNCTNRSALQRILFEPKHGFHLKNPVDALRVVSLVKDGG